MTASAELAARAAQHTVEENMTATLHRQEHEGDRHVPYRETAARRESSGLFPGLCAEMGLPGRAE